MNMPGRESFQPEQIEIDNSSREEVDASDFIPPGTFYAEGDDELTRERILAIQLVEDIGNQLALDYPEIVELYKDPTLRLIDIAYKYFPKEDVDKYPEVYSKAVGYAIRQLNPTDEQAEFTRQHRQYVAELNFNLNSPEFIEQCRAAAKKRHELHGVNTEAMIRGRGREPWSLAEKALVGELIENLNFQHQKGSIKGRPDYNKIAAELNRLFHDNQEIRKSNSVGSLVRDKRRKKKK